MEINIFVLNRAKGRTKGTLKAYMVWNVKHNPRIKWLRKDLRLKEVRSGIEGRLRIGEDL